MDESEELSIPPLCRSYIEKRAEAAKPIYIPTDKTSLPNA